MSHCSQWLNLRSSCCLGHLPSLNRIFSKVPSGPHSELGSSCRFILAASERMWLQEERVAAVLLSLISKSGIPEVPIYFTCCVGRKILEQQGSRLVECWPSQPERSGWAWITCPSHRQKASEVFSVEGPRIGCKGNFIWRVFWCFVSVILEKLKTQRQLLLDSVNSGTGKLAHSNNHAPHLHHTTMGHFLFCLFV